LDEFGKDAVSKADQDTLIQIAMDFIERQHSHIKLNRDYKVLERTHKGSVKMIQESLNQAFRTKDKDMDENIANMVKGFAPLATENPQTLIDQLNKDVTSDDTINNSPELNEKLSGIKLDTKPTRKGLIEIVGETSVSHTWPQPVYSLTISGDDRKVYILKVELPGVMSVSDCELDISPVCV